MTKSVFITGCSAGGIGAALAKAFHRQGFHVFASARDVSKMSDLKELGDDRITLVSLDVTSASSVASALQIVRHKTEDRLDYLINNSGAGSTMPFLDVDVEDAQKTFDVNLWGVFRVTQAFAPSLIAARGTIMNNCSISACIGLPFESQ
jgi:1-acylglycerone phosphate reductase